MLDSAVTIIDLLSLVTCFGIFIILLKFRKKFDSLTLAFIVFSLLIVTLVSISNCIENFLLDSTLDKYEDYLEILFIPLLVFSIYSLSLNQELRRRKIAEKTLRENTHRLNYALEGANEGLWDWDVNTNSLYFSSEFYKILEYKPFSFLANRENWIKLVHPLQRIQEEKYRDNFFNGDNESKTIELQLLAADGTYKWVILKGKTVERNPDGRPARISGIILDISSMKKIEIGLPGQCVT